MRFFSRFKFRATCRQIDRARRTEFPSRLEYLAFLTVIQRYFLYIFKRKLAQIHLSVLSISQLNSIIINTHVVCTHAANVDSFQSSHATVVLNLQTGKITYGIGDRKTIQRFQFLSGELLRRNHFVIPVGGNHYLSQCLYRVKRRRIGIRLSHTAKQRHHHTPHTSIKSLHRPILS